MAERAAWNPEALELPITRRQSADDGEASGEAEAPTDVVMRGRRGDLRARQDDASPTEDLRIRRFGARLHLLVHIPSIRQAALILRADLTAVRRWVIHALKRISDQE